MCKLMRKFIQVSIFIKQKGENENGKKEIRLLWS